MKEEIPKMLQTCNYTKQRRKFAEELCYELFTDPENEKDRTILFWIHYIKRPEKCKNEQNQKRKLEQIVHQ